MGQAIPQRTVRASVGEPKDVGADPPVPIVPMKHRPVGCGITIAHRGDVRVSAARGDLPWLPARN
jgi:hypothetical protein